MSPKAMTVSHIIHLLVLSSLFFSCYAEEFPTTPVPSNAFTEASVSLVNLIQLQNGLKSNQVKLGRVHSNDSRIGKSLFLKFVVEINGQKIEFTSADKVSRWSWVKGVNDHRDDYSNAKVFHSSKTFYDYEFGKGEEEASILPDFELSGPADIWLENAPDLRLALPHPVDAGEVRKVILNEGTRVIISGARGVHLSRPISLPLPLPSELQSLTKPPTSFQQVCQTLHASSLSKFRKGGKSILSLRIIEPLALRSASAKPPLPLPSQNERKADELSGGKGSEKAIRLKARRVSPISVEIRSREEERNDREKNVSKASEGMVPDVVSWPFPSLNFTLPNLMETEKAFSQLLGKALYEKGSFKILGASVETETVIRFPIEVDFLLQNGSEDSEPLSLARDKVEQKQKQKQEEQEEEWELERKKNGNEGLVTRREMFEIMAKITPEGKLLPLNLKSLDSVTGLVSIPSWLFDSGNGTSALPWMVPLSGMEVAIH